MRIRRQRRQRGQGSNQGSVPSQADYRVWEAYWVEPSLNTVLVLFELKRIQNMTTNLPFLPHLWHINTLIIEVSICWQKNGWLVYEYTSQYYTNDNGADWSQWNVELPLTDIRQMMHFNVKHRHDEHRKRSLPRGTSLWHRLHTGLTSTQSVIHYYFHNHSLKV